MSLLIKKNCEGGKTISPKKLEQGEGEDNFDVIRILTV